MSPHLVLEEERKTESLYPVRIIFFLKLNLCGYRKRIYIL